MGTLTQSEQTFHLVVTLAPFTSQEAFSLSLSLSLGFSDFITLSPSCPTRLQSNPATTPHYPPFSNSSYMQRQVVDRWARKRYFG